MAYLKLFAVRHAASTAFAVFVAFIVNYYLSYSAECWVLLTAFMVSQTTRGTPLRQGLLILVSLIVALIVSSLLLMYAPEQAIVYAVLMIMFMVSGTITYLNQLQSNRQWTFAIVFFLILLVATFSSYPSTELVRNRFFDVIMGAAIGILCRQFIFPVRFEKEFRDDIILVLKALFGYSHIFTENMVQREKQFPDCVCHFPEWVYESGFNPGLRSGFRYFLVHLERINDLFFSMSYLAAQPVDVDLFQRVNGDMVNAMQKNSELLGILIDYFESQKIKDTHSDFTSDIKQLESTLQQLLPAGLEILEITPEYMTLIALVRDIKDMRGLLLQLVMALPTDAKAK